MRTYHPKMPLYFNRIAWGATATIAGITLLSLLGELGWLLDLLTHFRVQIFQCGLLLAGLCLWVRRNKCAMVLIAIAVVNYVYILPLYMGKPVIPPDAGKPVRAMLMNLNAGNGNTEEVLHSISNASPDFIILEEVTPKWAYELSQLAEEYPYHIVEPREDYFGIMLLSRLPISNPSVVMIGPADVPSIIAEIQLPQGNLSLIGTHPVPPIGGVYSRHRNQQLALLAGTVKEQKYPVLLIGDLNASQWSAPFRNLLTRSGLHDSMKGFGFQPTWPAHSPLARIPLDQVLHSSEILIHNRRVGGRVGSDHLPVIVDFSLR